MRGLGELELLAPRFDLGARALLPEWKTLAAREGLGRDALDGLSIAATMLPLSVWIAVVSGAPPESGIVTATIASLVCVFFGGTHLAISGPSIVAALLVSRIANEHGMGAVGTVVIAGGAMSIAIGVLGLGRFVRFLPISVLRGCVLGIGLLILWLHLPSFFGFAAIDLAPPSERLDHIGERLPRANLAAIGIAVGTTIVALVLPLLHKRIPGVLIGVVLATIVAAIFAWDIPRLSVAELPALARPTLPSRGIAQLGGAAIALWLTMLTGTLISTAALERVSDKKTDADQELIGNGIASVLCGFLGALPATQSIARSMVALRSDARGRRASLVQAIVVALAGAGAFFVMPHVPVAALTGAAIFVAAPLLNPAPLRRLFRIEKFGAVVYTATALAMAVYGLLYGLQTGLALAIIGATFRLARTRALIHVSDDDSPHQVSFSGPITFLASMELTRLRKELGKIDVATGLVIDLRSVLAMDATGAEGLLNVFDDVRERGGRVALLGPSPLVKRRLLAACRSGEVESSIATSARDVEPILQKAAGMLGRPHLLAGIEHFREQMLDHYDSLFDQLADGQHPHTMFITCADSRISPSLLMGAHPGDLFIVRCIGALVPEAGSEHMPQEGAALEYGVGVLGVRHVVVCGHSKCGAISALKKGKVPPELATLTAWSEHAAKLAGDLSKHEDVDAAARAVTIKQLEHLKTYPLVRERIDHGALTVHAWFYDLGTVELLEYDETHKEYAVLGARKEPPPPA